MPDLRPGVCWTSSGWCRVAEHYARNLCYGDQRRLEMARALALSPRVLLLDEPTAGMNPAESGGVRRVRSGARGAEAFSVLLIEHDMKVVMRSVRSGDRAGSGGEDRGGITRGGH